MKPKEGAGDALKTNEFLEKFQRGKGVGWRGQRPSLSKTNNEKCTAFTIRFSGGQLSDCSRDQRKEF